MFDLKLGVENFLAIKKADLESKNNITVLIAPNRSGKTHLLLLLYTVFWQLWKELKDDNLPSSDNLFLEKLKSVFLWKKPADFISWNAKESKVKIETDFQELSFNIHNNKLKILKKIVKDKNKAKCVLGRSPIYIQSAGLGDYYKGIFSIKKYYPSWKIVSDTVADLVSDLFIVADATENPSSQNKKYLETFEKFFSSRFFINNYRIYIQERGKKYGIEKAASGLKSLSWFYLILRYNLLGNVLFIDEPEVNLHPEYIDKLTYFIYKLSQGRKIFIQIIFLRALTNL